MSKVAMLGISVPAAAAVVAIALFATTGVSTPAHAKVCHPYGTIIGSAGVAVKNDTAKKFGRINWRVKVRAGATLGTGYTDWGIAEEREYHCQKKLGTWRCSAEARPCKP